MTTHYRKGANGKTYARVKYPDYGWSDSEYEVESQPDIKPKVASRKSSTAASKTSSLSSASAFDTEWPSKALKSRNTNDSDILLEIDIDHDNVNITMDGQLQPHSAIVEPRKVAGATGIRDAGTRVQIKYRGPKQAVQLLLRGDTKRFCEELEHLPLALSHGRAVLDGYSRDSGRVYGIRNQIRPSIARKTTDKSINDLRIGPEGDHIRGNLKDHTFMEKSYPRKPFSLTQSVTLGSLDKPEVYLEKLEGHPHMGEGSILRGAKQLERAHPDKTRGTKLLANAKAVGLKTGKDGAEFRVERKFDMPVTGSDKLVKSLTAAQKNFLRKAGLVDGDDPKHSGSIFRNT